MSITDELRSEANKMDWIRSAVLRGIADRIDAEHKRLMAEQFESLTVDMQPMTDENMAESGWIRLPKDADGEYIHIGDVLTDDAEFKSEGKVVRLMLENEGWMCWMDGLDWGTGWTEPSIHEWHHHHEPTVEDVLHQFLGECESAINLGYDVVPHEVFAEYAAKLCLANDGKEQ